MSLQPKLAGYSVVFPLFLLTLLYYWFSSFNTQIDVKGRDERKAKKKRKKPKVQYDNVIIYTGTSLQCMARASAIIARARFVCTPIASLHNRTADVVGRQIVLA